MRKSCLVLLILLAAILMAVSVSLRRCYLRAAEAEQLPQPAAATSATLPGAQATLAAAVLSAEEATGEGIDGMSLGSLRPLSMERLDVYGLAAAGAPLYYLGRDVQGVWLVRRQPVGESASEEQATMAIQGTTQAAGLFASGEDLWVWFSSRADGGMTQVIVLDGAALSERSRLILHESVSVLEATPGGEILGVSEDGNWYLRWPAIDGDVERLPNASGARYSDCERVQGSLVCAGRGDDGAGLLDVLDTASLSLLARHRAEARTEAGGLVVDGAWTYRNGEFLFVPQGGDLPVLWTFALTDTTPEAYLPSLQ
ncbi:MAG: hypothetical protein GXX94_10980 [Chloroflexi bacterium]|nr:hypothetical protein [Chloroflexota bacterium]